jgi:mycothiol synthase
MSANHSFLIREFLDPREIAAVANLVEVAAVADGARPLSEHAWLHLRHGGDSHSHHVLAIDDSANSVEGEPTITGYAHVDITDTVEGASAELVVSPNYRNMGIGTQLVNAAIDLSPDGRLRLWAHGETSGAQELARSLGFNQERSLWQMRRSLFAPLPPVEIPEGVRIRTFDASRDLEEWLKVNRAAFVDLPDQKSWSEHDLQLRINESWFRPEGFFVAERVSDSAMVGFHWTKVHGGHDHHEHESEHQHDPIGEIYVLAVDPDSGIRGLGRALSIIGLTYLRSLGLTQAMLYVDEQNSRAISLYTGLGFVHWDTDILYRRG